MNVMKQDAMDDKIKERCKTCEKQCMQEDLDRSRSYRVAIEHKLTSMDRTAIEQTESFSMDQESIKKLSRKSLESSLYRDCVNFYQDKKKEGLNR